MTKELKLIINQIELIDRDRLLIKWNGLTRYNKSSKIDVPYVKFRGETLPLHKVLYFLVYGTFRPDYWVTCFNSIDLISIPDLMAVDGEIAVNIIDESILIDEESIELTADYEPEFISQSEYDVYYGWCEYFDQLVPVFAKHGSECSDFDFLFVILSGQISPYIGTQIKARDYQFENAL